MFLKKNSKTLQFLFGTVAFLVPLACSAAQIKCGSPHSPIILDDSTFVAVEGESAYTTSAGKLLVSGHPLRPELSLARDSGVVSCHSSSDLRLFYQNVVQDEQVLKALSDWDEWVSSRPKACSSAVDSAAYVQPGAHKVALVFHGLYTNPQAMETTIQFLLNAGYNVIAPRLSEHFEADIKSMDKADYRDWLRDADQAFALAQEFSPEQVTVVGYSLGGLLASHLALQNPGKIDRLLLFAPAWRVSLETSGAIMLGSLFHLNLNDLDHTTPSCKTGFGYAPVVGGEQVAVLVNVMESGRGNHVEWNDSRSIFAQIKVPTLVLVGDGDAAVSSGAISEICMSNARNCSPFRVQSGDHFDTSTWLPRDPVTPAGTNVSSTILRFLAPKEMLASAATIL